ncbi:ABC-type enterochelin transport system%2C ATPase component [Streptococcus pneumoniae]|nr:ABC-type enterochelin transport system%2C ATPase component [Streptococcus pneumoniae]
MDVLQTEVLRELYEMDVKVESVNGQRICLYYDEQILS